MNHHIYDFVEIRNAQICVLLKNFHFNILVYSHVHACSINFIDPWEVSFALDWLSSLFLLPLATQLSTARQVKVQIHIIPFIIENEYYDLIFLLLLLEWPPTVVDASKSSSEFQKQLDDAALKVKTSYW